MVAVARGGTLQALANDPTPDVEPRFSPDGSWIAFASYRTGKRAIWIVPSVGEPARLVAEMDMDLWKPSWSPDGEFLAFNSFDIWVVPVNGGPPRQLTTTGEPILNMQSEWSPDGREIIYSSSGRLWRVSVNGGEASPLTRGPAHGARWSNDGRRIFFQGVRERQPDIWVLDLEDGSERPVTDLAGRRGELASIALHENAIYFTWRENLGDLWVMDVEQ